MSLSKFSIRSFFSSVRLTIVLLILIAAISVAGTLIPQQENAAEFISRLNPLTAKIMLTLQACDIFHSYIFQALMVLLSLNILVCSINRIAVTRRLINASAFPVPTDLWEKTEPDSFVLTDLSADEARLRLETLLRKRCGNVQTEKKESLTCLFSERHRFSHFGVYIVHLSILVLILGALAGSFFGFEGYLNLDEGQSAQAIELKGGQGSKPLGFAVRCDHFGVEFYENGAPKTYRSDLSFIRNGQVVQQGALLVNHPLALDGIRFYQASYGISPQSRALLSYTKDGVEKRDVAVSPGTVFELAGSKDSVMVLRLEQNLMGIGPAVKLSIASLRGNVQFWVLKNLAEIKRMNPNFLEQMPMFNPGLFQPYVFTLNGMEEKYYTGLQVVSDPGLPIVMAGGFLLLIGLLIVFFLDHRRCWLCIDSWEGKTRIRVACHSSKKKWGAQREIAVLLTHLRKELK
jgi:cytochrome c biogenesis protein